MRGDAAGGIKASMVSMGHSPDWPNAMTRAYCPPPLEGPDNDQVAIASRILLRRVVHHHDLAQVISTSLHLVQRLGIDPHIPLEIAPRRAAFARPHKLQRRRIREKHRHDSFGVGRGRRRPHGKSEMPCDGFKEVLHARAKINCIRTDLTYRRVIQRLPGGMHQRLVQVQNQQVPLVHYPLLLTPPSAAGSLAIAKEQTELRTIGVADVIDLPAVLRGDNLEVHQHFFVSVLTEGHRNMAPLAYGLEVIDP